MRLIVKGKKGIVTFTKLQNMDTAVVGFSWMQINLRYVRIGYRENQNLKRENTELYIFNHNNAQFFMETFDPNE